MLKNLCEISSPSASEERMKEYIVQELKEFVDSYYEDDFKNLILRKRSKVENALKVCIECSIDEPFVMISAKNIEEKEMRFTAPPQLVAKDFEGKKLRFEDGRTFEIKSDNEEEKIGFSSLYSSDVIDDKNFGDKAVLFPDFSETEELYSAQGLRYKAPIYAIMDAVKKISDNTFDLYFLFTVQGCVGKRGLKALMSGKTFDVVLSVDSVLCSADITQGDGAVIAAKEKGAVLSVGVRKKLVETAEKNNVLTIVGLVDKNYTAKTILTTGEGAMAALVLIPFNDKLPKADSIIKSDMENVTKLLVSYCKEEKFCI